jgi:hypothetical protein
MLNSLTKLECLVCQIRLFDFYSSNSAASFVKFQNRLFTPSLGDIKGLLVMCHPDPQYLAASVREAKYTRLGHGTRLGKLHTLDPPLALAFSRNSHSAIADSEQENNQETLDKLYIPQADSPMTGLHNSN